VLAVDGGPSGRRRGRQAALYGGVRRQKRTQDPATWTVITRWARDAGACSWSPDRADDRAA
jgi:hypothetical protein